MQKMIICRGGAPVRHKLHIVCGCVPRRLLIPLFLTSVKSHASVRRRKLRIVYGCVSRRLLTPLLLLSVKSHAAALLLACKRARDAPPCYQLFTGKTRSRRLTLATNFLRGKRAYDGSLLLPTFYGIIAVRFLYR